MLQVPPAAPAGFCSAEYGPSPDTRAALREGYAHALVVPAGGEGPGGGRGTDRGDPGGERHAWLAMLLNRFGICEGFDWLAKVPCQSTLSYPTLPWICSTSLSSHANDLTRLVMLRNCFWKLGGFERFGRTS